MENKIFVQDGRYINVLWPSPVVRAGIFCEEERQQIKLLVRHGFMPHHSAVGKGRCHVGTGIWRSTEASMEWALSSLLLALSLVTLTTSPIS